MRIPRGGFLSAYVPAPPPTPEWLLNGDADSSIEDEAAEDQPKIVEPAPGLKMLHYLDPEVQEAVGVLTNAYFEDDPFAQNLLRQVRTQQALSEKQLSFILGCKTEDGTRIDNSPKDKPALRFTLENKGIAYPIKDFTQYEVELKFKGLPPNAKAEDCIKTADFPYMNFPYEYFNPAQSEFMQEVDANNNVVVCAKTSAGKSTIAEMIASRVLSVDRVENPSAKVAYIAPLKALAKEKEDDWTGENHPFSKLNISILTGDFVLTPARKKELAFSDIICMSSEMLGSRIRRTATEKNKFLSDIKVLVVDEAHLITMDGRGPNLEAAIVKFTAVNPDCRVVFLSATMPNVDELGEWLTHLNGKPTTIIKSTYRPVDLKWNFETFIDHQGYAANEHAKVNEGLRIVAAHPNDKFIIFVHTKKTGRMMLRELQQMQVRTEFHNADLAFEKRMEVEKSFKSRDAGSLRVLVATSTIAWGCFHESTNIIMADGQYLAIKDIKKNKKVMSYSTANNLRVNKVVKEGIKKVPNDRAYKITVANGEELVCSNNHPIACIKDGEVFYKNAEHITLKDWVLCVSDTRRVMDSKITTRSDIAKARILGYVFGDGCLCDAGQHADKKNKYSLDIACDAKHRDYLLKIISEFNMLGIPLSESHIITNQYDGVLHLRTKQRKATDFIKKHIRVLPKANLKIPKFIITNDTLLKEFIQWLFLADGGVCKHMDEHYSIEYNTIDKILAQDVRYALLRFGVYSIISLKKCKGNTNIIKKKNGTKHTIVSRHDLYRIRIYARDIMYFHFNIGFPTKTVKDVALGNAVDSWATMKENASSLHYSRDRIPLGNYIRQYQKEKKILTKDLRFLKIDPWTIANKSKATSREVIYKMVHAFGSTPQLDKIIAPSVRYEQIKKIEKVQGGSFYDLEVAKDNTYTANTIIAHNCNMPARRVLILGLHRGINLVDPIDVVQEGGRAGRVGLDTHGDVHVLVRKTKLADDIKHCKTVNPIRSKIAYEDELAFHLVSEIAEKNVRTLEEAIAWFSRTLAYKQMQIKFEDDELVHKRATVHVTEIMQNLIDNFAIKKNKQDAYTPTAIGFIASWFYLSPFDVSDWRANFKKILDKGDPSEIEIAWAIGNRHSLKGDYAAKLGAGDALIKELHNKGYYLTDGTKKHIYAIYCIIKDKTPDVADLFSLMGQHRMDIERVMSAIELLDTHGKYFNKCAGVGHMLEIPLRVKYGIDKRGIELVLLPSIGRKTAKSLMTQKVFTCRDILARVRAGQAPVTKNLLEKIMPVVEEIARVGYVEYIKQQRMRRRKKRA